MTTGDTDPIAREVAAVRASFGLWLRDDHTFVRITGTDAASWLQSQTTNDVLALKSGEGHHNAALDRQGRLQAHFTLHRWTDEYWMLIERAQWPHLREHLDAHLFIEDAKMEETGGDFDQLILQGPKTLPILANVLGTDHVSTNDLLPSALHGVHPVEIAGIEALAFRASPTGEDGYALVVEKGQGRALADELLSRAHELGHDALEISPAARDTLRIEAGIPRFGVDIEQGQVIAETGLDRDCVSYTKGCYLGQEVVARLKTYGSPKRAIMGLVFRSMGGSPIRVEPARSNNRRIPFEALSEDPRGPIHKRHGAKLPHWTRENATYFITYRLAGTLPADIQNFLGQRKPSAFFDCDAYLDAGGGSELRITPEIADVIQQNWMHFHLVRYFLCAWSIMPNHVHVVVRLFPFQELEQICHSWKSYTSHRANKILARKGRYWQDESYDHVVRDEADYWRCVNYTIQNPEKAGLTNWKWTGHNDLGEFIDQSAQSDGAYGRAAHTTKTSVLSGEKPVGETTSACESPTLNSRIALASLDRDHRAPATIVEVDRTQAEVVALPFYESPSREERAQALYDRALLIFQQDSDDIDPAAIPLLEEALLLHPRYEDAYEVLGVILHRQGRTDDAIRVMRQLAALNPDCLMAHTNLSVFYVAKGLIPEAEEEKAKAAVLQIERAGAERAAREAAESERGRIESEARERIRMFREVLDIDPDDPLATFGLGKAYIQLNQFADALPHLERATQVQKDYSAAWLDLAKCHEFLGHTADAIAAYKLGIAAASRKGDVMPMREMERRLKALEVSAV